MAVSILPFLRHRFAPSCLPVLGLSVWSASAMAGQTIDSGQLLRQNLELVHSTDSAGQKWPQQEISSSTDSANAHNGLHFLVADFRFDDDLSPMEQKRAEAFLNPWRGQQMTLSQLQALRSTLSAELSRENEVLVSVSLPPQTVLDGVVHFAIERGHIQSVRVDNHSGVATRRLQALLMGDQASPPTLARVNEQKRFVEDIPGVGSTTSILSSGTEPGGVVVDVSVAPAAKFYGTVDMDNYGSPQAGRYRLGTVLGVNNPLGQGDRLEAIAYVTPPGLQTSPGPDGRTRLGRMSYDVWTGWTASRAGVAYSHVDYRLGGLFAGLGTGSADVSSVYAVYPVLRSDRGRLDFSANVDIKRSYDEKFAKLIENRRHSTVASFRVDGSASGAAFDRPHAAQYSVGIFVGKAREDEWEYGQNAPVLIPRRRFLKLESSVDVQQSLTPTSQLRLAARAQWANRGLDSSEQMGLGGAFAVRAFDQNATAVDTGIIASATLSQSIRSIPGASVDMFYDAARGRVHGAAGAMTSTRAQGLGVGAQYTWKGLTAQMSYALRTGHRIEQAPPHQTWITFSASF